MIFDFEDDFNPLNSHFSIQEFKNLLISPPKKTNSASAIATFNSSKSFSSIAINNLFA